MNFVTYDGVVFPVDEFTVLLSLLADSLAVLVVV